MLEQPVAQIHVVDDAEAEVVGPVRGDTVQDGGHGVDDVVQQPGIVVLLAVRLKPRVLPPLEELSQQVRDSLAV